MNENKKQKGRGVSLAKECAYAATFTALLIAAQLCLAAIPSVEVVTPLFLSYAFAFGGRRGAVVGVAFSLLRQLVFGFFPSVLVLYLLYYPLTAALFGWLGGKVRKPLPALWWLTGIACFCTFGFSLLDSVITPLWYRFTAQASWAYFLASLPIAGTQVVCTAATVALSFLPLTRALAIARKGLKE